MTSLVLTRQLATSVMCMLLISGCAVHGGWHHDAAHGPRSVPSLHVPPGHLPPPGQCRIWFPDRPPGHQPPPAECHELRHNVPAGGVLVQG